MAKFKIYPKPHRYHKRSCKAKRVKPSFLSKMIVFMRDYQILQFLAVATFLYLQYCACTDYGPPVKCTRLDPCRTRNFACSFKCKDDFEGVCVNTEIYGLSMPWPYDLVMKWEREKAEGLKREKAAEKLKREMAAAAEDSSLIPENKLDSHLKAPDTPVEPEPQLTESPVILESELPDPDTAINLDPENNESSSKTNDKVGFEVEKKISSPSTGNENASWKITMTATNKAEMDRYKRVKAQQRKIQKTLLERMEKILFEQFGTTAEERETAAKAKRGRKFRKKYQDKNLSDGKTRDETFSSDPALVPEGVVAKADNVQQSIDGTELGFDVQYGLHSSGNTVFLDGNGFAEGPAIDDGNYTTEFSPREDMYPSQDEQLFELSSHEVPLPFDPTLGDPLDPTLREEGMQPDYSVVIAGSYDAAAFQSNTSLARVVLHNVLYSPVTGPLFLITLVVSVMVRIVITAAIL